ncbi:hypothetical protein ACJMK2_022352 [Sinanodonta woodiana]|uniref:TIR domain-containing protein n=1 Tax=Sinanodonta woodiana TaxID=1069815 RepID=A0ABD3TKQ8_SINWO
MKYIRIKVLKIEFKQIKIEFYALSNFHADGEMEIDDLESAAVDDIRYGTKTTYDAFVSYNEEPKDLEFVKKMIRELEGNQNLKLFVPGRGDIPGAAKYVVTAAMIEKRSKRLIPVLIEKSPILRILKFLTVCDLTIRDMEDWVWDRLSLAVQAPLPQHTSASMKHDPESHRPDNLGHISLELSGIYSAFRHSQDFTVEMEPESPPQAKRLVISNDYNSLQRRQNSNYSGAFEKPLYQAIEHFQSSAISREYASLSMETDFENFLDESIYSTQEFSFV